MKKITLLFSLIVSIVISGQEKFELTKDKGLSEYVITQIPNKSASEIYTKINEWLQKTYKNPDYVLKGAVINDYVRFEGVNNEIMCQNPENSTFFYCTKIKYEIEIYVKDDRYKFSVINLQNYRNGINAYIPAGYIKLEQTGTWVYNKKGELRSSSKQLINLPIFFNTLNESLKEYILNGSTSKGTDW